MKAKERDELLEILRERFESNMRRHKGIEWEDVRAKLVANADKLAALHGMEKTGGEPDVIGRQKDTGELVFVDCSSETPKERRSVCYDREARDARKEHKPKSSATEMAADIGIELLTEQQYRDLQKLGPFDAKTSSWLKTPEAIRTLGGAIFGDYRYGTVFVYHNGAQSYYAARGFRGLLKV